MCLGIPMRIVNIKGEFARVEAGRLMRQVNIQMVPLARVGDYVIVHAGFAIEILNQEGARRTLSLLEE